MALYRTDIVDIDLGRGKGIFRSFFPFAIGKNDEEADRFGVRVHRNGADVDLTGVTVQGFFRDPAGNNIAITSGNIIIGNEAYVVLPQACYNYEGQFCLAIKLIGGGVTGTMRIVDGVVSNTNVGGAVAPTGAVPTYQEIIAQYEEMIAATTAAESSKAAVEDQTGNKLVVFTEGYYIDTSGSTVDVTDVQVSSDGFGYAVIDVSEGDKFTLNIKGGISARAWCWIDSSGNVLSVADASITRSDLVITAPENADKLVLNDKGGKNCYYGTYLRNTVDRIESAYILDHNKAKRLNSTDDLNDITAVGNYYIGTTSDAQSIANMPAAHPGRLYVYTLLANVLMQEYYSYDSGEYSYRRIRNAVGTWSDWKELIYKDALFGTWNLKYTESEAIPAESDLDDYTNVGNYYVNSTDNAQSNANMPIMNAGRLIVMNLNSTIKIQKYIAYRGEVREFIRSKSGSYAWSEWKELSSAFRQHNLIRFDNEENYQGSQGFVITDKYIYISCIKDDTDEKVYKYNKYSFVKLDEITLTGQVRHANDFTWNPADKKIYCATGGGSMEIVVFNEEFEQLTGESITMSLDGVASLSNIAYDAINGLWAVSGGRGSGSGNEYKIYVMSDLRDTSTTMKVVTYTGNANWQSLAMVGNVIYALAWDGRIRIYDIISGSEIDATSLYNYLGEYECIQVINNYAYYNVQYKVEGETRYVTLYSTPVTGFTNIPTLLT